MKSLNLALFSLLSLIFVLPAQAAFVVSDPQSSQILSTIVALDENEILLAVQATNKNPSSNVLDFAKMMIDDHGKNMTMALDLANKIHALPLNGNPDNIHDKGTKELSTLAALDADRYNSGYIDAMVSGHEAVLNMLDTKLLTAAKNSDLKAFLTDTRAAVAHHLDAAKKVQAEMKS